jgi:hypothetical protein
MRRRHEIGRTAILPQAIRNELPCRALFGKLVWRNDRRSARSWCRQQ